MPIRSMADYVGAVNDLHCAWHGRSRDVELWYRGHRNDRGGPWRLLPVWYRDEPWRGLSAEDEDRIYTTFRLQAPHVAPAIAASIDYRDDWGWLATMRHYGGPTRLLDWTDSPLVALHFALGGEGQPEPDVDATVWILDASALNRAFVGPEYGDVFFPKRCDEVRLLPDHSVDQSEISYFYLPGKGGQRCAGPPALPICISVPPTNPRVVAQHGTFSMHGADPRDLQEIVEAKGFDRLHRLTIPGACVEAVREEVFAWLSEPDVFPDLDAVSRRLKRVWSDRRRVDRGVP